MLLNDLFKGTMQFIIEITHLRFATSRPGFIGHQQRLGLMVALIYKRDKVTEDEIVTQCWSHCRQKNRRNVGSPSQLLT